MYCGVPSDNPVWGQPLAARAFDGERDPEIRNACVAILEENVLGFDVAVNDTGRMGVRQSIRDLDRDANGGIDRQLALPGEPGAQGLSRDVRHDIVQATGIAAVEERKDVRMLKASRRLDFGEEPFGADRRSELRVEDLDRDVAIVPQIARKIDRRHAAAAELTFHPVSVGERRLQLLEKLVGGHGALRSQNDSRGEYGAVSQRAEAAGYAPRCACHSASTFFSCSAPSPALSVS